MRNDKYAVTVSRPVLNEFIRNPFQTIEQCLKWARAKTKYAGYAEVKILKLNLDLDLDGELIRTYTARFGELFNRCDYLE